MERRDKETVIAMMRTFYTSPAVLTNGSEKIFDADVEACVSDSPYLEGYVFECREEICGYGMLAKSFSTEFGRRCIWIEDLYVVSDYRGRGIGGGFLSFVRECYPEALLRLEVEEENERAISVYKRMGYDVFPYMEMKQLPKER